MPIKKAVAKLLKKPVTSGKDKLWPLIDENRQLGHELRLPYDRRWTINLSFIAGSQYTFYNKSAELLQHIKQRKGRLRVTDNKILPRYIKQVSRLIQTNPRMNVVPSSLDNEDIKAAKVGDKALEHFWHSKAMRKEMRRLAGWIYSCGNYFLEDVWDTKSGPLVADENGTLKYSGDVGLLGWSPFELTVPVLGFNCVDLDDMLWVQTNKFYSLEQIRTSYPARGLEVEAETRPIPFMDSSLIMGTSDTTLQSKMEGAVVTRMKIKPCSEYPRGLFLVGANGIVLVKEDYPYDSYHIEHFKDIEIPGVFWGMCETEAAIWLQKMHNRTLSDEAEFNRTMARGKWLVPKQSKLEVNPDDTHGQRLDYNPVMGHKPEMMTIKGLPASYEHLLNHIAISLMELYHQHEVTSGTNKSDIRSGEMVSLLLEQDDTGNIPAHAITEESLEAIMTRVLRRMKKGYTSERIISIVGSDGEHDIMAFQGADLRNNTDVKVTKGSSLPDSRHLRQLKIMEKYREGLYGDPQDPKVREKVLRMLDEVPDTVRDIFAEDNMDRRIAGVENKVMVTNPGIKLIVNAYDNHAIHIEVHRKDSKQPEWQKIKLEDPNKFMGLEVTKLQHTMQHEKFLAEEQKAEEARMVRMAELQKRGR